MKRNIETGWVRNLLLILLSVVFIFSAVSKLTDVTLFEVTVYASGVPLMYAELVSRVILIAEISIAVLLLLSIRKSDFFILLLTFAFLTVFDVSLLYDIVVHGGKENCGCFGDIISMTSQEALLKNVMIQLVIIPFLIFTGNRNKRHWLFFLVSFAVTATLVMLNFPITSIRIGENNSDMKVQLLEETGLGELPDSLFIQLKNKEQFLMFVHPKCKHCQTFTTRLNKFYEQDVLPETTLLMYGDIPRIDSFNRKTNNRLPYLSISKKAHLKTSRGVFPSIYYVRKDSLYGPWSSNMFNVEKIMKDLGARK